MRRYRLISVGASLTVIACRVFTNLGCLLVADLITINEPNKASPTPAVRSPRPGAGLAAYTRLVRFNLETTLLIIERHQQAPRSMPRASLGRRFAPEAAVPYAKRTAPRILAATMKHHAHVTATKAAQEAQPEPPPAASPVPAKAGRPRIVSSK
jgi:hypothetical protein